MILIFLGKPGSGKGTQAELVAKKFKIPTISMGELLRQSQDEKLKEIMQNGELVPNDITFDILNRRISKDDCKEGFILDGFPRNLAQAEHLDVKIDKVIYIDIPDEIIVKRLSSRLECACGMTFNTITKPPKKEGVCDKCGKELYRRKDDNPETIRKRLKTYNELTSPLIKLYEEKGILIKINGDREIKKIFDEIIKILS